jgi:hypothetical protein
MSAAARKIATKLYEPPTRSNLPVFELRLSRGKAGSEVAVWQLPSLATPRLHTPEYLAALHGTPLRLIESRLLKRLARAKILLSLAMDGKRKTWPIDEDLALNLGLLFRVLAPMRHLNRIREVAEGIDTMPREEAAYWLGMAVHRKNPRRVLAALRTLMTSA